MNFKFVLGIPSFNEVETIGNVVRQCDDILSAQGLDRSAIIVNADNGSSDGTQEVFACLPTRCKKISINTKSPGKGGNVKAMAEFVVQENMSALMIVDADLSSVDASWIYGSMLPIKEGKDAAFSRRPPLWNRGDLTYQLCYPALAAISGVRIREPIAPTQAYSKKLLQRALGSNWIGNRLRFGVDIFLAHIASRMDWVEVSMPVQLEHKLRSFSSGEINLVRGKKYEEVLLSLRGLALRSDEYPTSGLRERCIGDTFSECGQVVMDNEYEILLKKTENVLRRMSFSDALAYFLESDLRKKGGYNGISWQTWRYALRKWLQDEAPQITSDTMQILLLARCVGLYRETIGRRDWYQVVESQVDDFIGYFAEGKSKRIG